MIAAIILAAGESKRMGQPKMLLPWGNITVIEQVITTYFKAGIESILVITGGAHQQVKKAVERYPVQSVYNENYPTGEMLSSLQLGLKQLPHRVEAALVGLGDQPQVQEESVRLICDAYRETGSRLVVPSFQMKRGHPWLVASSLWSELLELQPPTSSRDFLNRYAREIHYVNMNTPTILADLDTPADYEKFQPR